MAMMMRGRERARKLRTEFVRSESFSYQGSFGRILNLNACMRGFCGYRWMDNTSLGDNHDFSMII